MPEMEFTLEQTIRKQEAIRQLEIVFDDITGLKGLKVNYIDFHPYIHEEGVE